MSRRPADEKLRFSEFCMCVILLMGQCHHRWHFWYVFVVSAFTSKLAVPNYKHIPTSLRDAVPHQQNLSHAQTFRRTISGSHLPRKRLEWHFT